jgi:ribonuclease HI
MAYKLFTDGGARGNPGPGAIGAVIKDAETKRVATLGKYLGTCTNNEAEYAGLIEGMRLALEKDIRELECFLDSELVVKQLNGIYKVKNNKLAEFFATVKELEKQFSAISYRHIPREKNSEADALVNQTLDEKLRLAL